MKYKITIREVIPAEGEKYPKEETVFEQVIDGISVSELVVYVNTQNKLKNN